MLTAAAIKITLNKCRIDLKKEIAIEIPQASVQAVLFGVITEIAASACCVLKGHNLTQSLELGQKIAPLGACFRATDF